MAWLVPFNCTSNHHVKLASLFQFFNFVNEIFIYLYGTIESCICQLNQNIQHDCVSRHFHGTIQATGIAHILESSGWQFVIHC